MTVARAKNPGAKSRARDWLELLLGFVCVFVGLSLPLPGVGQAYTQAHRALGNALLPSSLSSGVELGFLDAADPEAPAPNAWTLTLRVKPPAPQGAALVPIDLRTLSYLPTCCFLALAVATPLGSRRRNLVLVGVGLAILEPLLLALIALPIVSFLGGTGPVRAFDLGLATHTVLQLLYRSLVASPGMAYAIPLFLWWMLVVRLTRAGSGISGAFRNS